MYYEKKRIFVVLMKEDQRINITLYAGIINTGGLNIRTRKTFSSGEIKR